MLEDVLKVSHDVSNIFRSPLKRLTGVGFLHRDL